MLNIGILYRKLGQRYDLQPKMCVQFKTYNRGRQPSAVTVPGPPGKRSVQVETYL